MTSATARDQEARIFVGAAIRMLGPHHPESPGLIEKYNKLGGIWVWPEAMLSAAPPEPGERTLDDIIDDARGRWK